MIPETKNKKWYQGKYAVFFALVALISVFSLFVSNSNIENTNTSGVKSFNYVSPASYQTVQTNTPATNNTYTKQDSNLSNNNYYTNTYGNTVHSPAYSDSVPAGATAECRDGTYSFSQSRRGTCSRHGGVASWL